MTLIRVPLQPKMNSKPKKYRGQINPKPKDKKKIIRNNLTRIQPSHPIPNPKLVTLCVFCGCYCCLNVFV